MLTKEQIQKEIEEMNEWIPVSKIEENLGMPSTTLQKVLKGIRPLPKKWEKKLEAYFVVNSTPVSKKNNHQKPLEPKDMISEQKPKEEKSKQHKLYKEGDPPEKTNAFYLKKGCFTYDELEKLNTP